MASLMETAPRNMSFSRIDKEHHVDGMSDSTTVADDDLERIPGQNEKARYLRIVTALSTLVILLFTVALSIATFASTPSPFYQQMHSDGHAVGVAITPQEASTESSSSQMHHHATTGPEHNRTSKWLRNCGNATMGSSYARSLGCKFDVISFSWLPPACYDEDLSNTFRNYTSAASEVDTPGWHWKWWTEPEAIHEVSLGRVMRGEFEELYVDFEYHLVHCTYMWRKMHRALLQVSQNDMMVRDHGHERSEEPPVALESYLLNMNHTHHCEKMLLAGGSQTIEGGKVGTKIQRKFPDCVWL